MNREPDYWDRRLHNWALYYFGGGSLRGTSSLELLANTNPYWTDGTHEIALVGEAIDTDALVSKLDEAQRKTCKAWYWWSGTKEMIAADLRISVRTAYWRIERIKLTLTDLQQAARIRQQAVRAKSLAPFA